MTLDADLTKEDAALRKTYLGTDNYLMGFRIGEYIKKAKPNGGTVCLIEGNAGRRQHSAPRLRARAMRLSGKKGLDRLKGEGGWTEVAGCPVFTNDDGPRACRRCRTSSPPIRNSTRS